MLRVLTFVFAASLAIPCHAGGKPLPAGAALNAAKKLIIDTFRKELSDSDKTPAVKAMLETADKTERDAEKAALYLSAADVASRGPRPSWPSRCLSSSPSHSTSICWRSSWPRSRRPPKRPAPPMNGSRSPTARWSSPTTPRSKAASKSRSPP